MSGTVKTRISLKNIKQLESSNETYEKTTGMVVSVLLNVSTHIPSGMPSYFQCEIRREERITLLPHSDDMATSKSDPTLPQQACDESKATDPSDNVVLIEDDSTKEKEDIVYNDSNFPEEEKMVEDGAFQLV